MKPLCISRCLFSCAALALTLAWGGDAATGQKVYEKACFACHATPMLGAPVLGSQADWEPRLAQGTPTLYKHALEGFQGKKGAMPAKGGNPALSDAEVKAAVDYMVSKAK